MKFMAKYPFLKGAEAVVKERKIGLEQILEDIVYEQARARGFERVKEAVEKGSVENRPIGREIEQLNEILSYPIARMIVSSSGDRFLVSRYALGEAMLLENKLVSESQDKIVEIAKDLDVEVDTKGDEYLIHFTTFLSATASIRAKEWKLVNQEIFNGYVKLKKEKLARVLRQRLNDKINNELPRPVTNKIVDIFGEEARGLSSQMEEKRKEYAAGEMGPIDDASFPPCMKTILTMIRAGENVPHTGRFAITSFLHTIGMSGDKIMELFSTAPDFDPSKSEYQIRHIVGEISGTEYTPPECATMKSYGICYNPDNLCQREWMTHPLKYYRNMKKKRSGFSKRSPYPDKALSRRDVRPDDKDEHKDVKKGK